MPKNFLTLIRQVDGTFLVRLVTAEGKQTLPIDHPSIAHLRSGIDFMISLANETNAGRVKLTTNG